MRFLSIFACWVLLTLQAAAAQIDHGHRIATVIDPAKMVTLEPRSANPLDFRRAPAIMAAWRRLPKSCPVSRWFLAA